MLVSAKGCPSIHLHLPPFEISPFFLSRCCCFVLVRYCASFLCFGLLLGFVFMFFYGMLWCVYGFLLWVVGCAGWLF